VVSYEEVVLIAFVSQLAVLPGEKVQFMIAALSTRYDPKVVVAAAGTAFALWTALEIAFGRLLQVLLSPLVLDLITATLFFAFAVILYRSAPSRGRGTADGGILDVESIPLPRVLERYRMSMGGFLPIFALTATGEFGDKTQLVTIGLAVQYGATSAIWVGEMLAIIPVSLLNAYAFHRLSGRIDTRLLHYGSALLFAAFGADVVISLVFGVSPFDQLMGLLFGGFLPI
jgi:putative Ca2+/H+ antiporter (TMEM165/GDT1 family)